MLAKSAVRTDAARTQRRPEDDYPSTPVAQRASRKYTGQPTLTQVKRSSASVRTEKPTPSQDRQDAHCLAVTRPSTQGREQDEDRLPVTNPGGRVWTRGDDREPRRLRLWPAQTRAIGHKSAWWGSVSRQKLIIAIIFIILAAWLTVQTFFLVSGYCTSLYNRYTYGPTPTTTVYGTFGHNNDSDESPSSITVTNEHGHLRIYEIPAGDDTKARFYPYSATLIGDHVDQLPAVLSVLDVHHDGKPDVLIQIGQHITLKLINNGSDFTLKSS